MTDFEEQQSFLPEEENGLFRELPPDKELTRLVEALIFASDGPLSVARISEALEGLHTPAEIRAACQTLRLEYDQLNRAFELVEVADGFQFRTRPEYGELVARLRKTSPLRLSKAALETLSIVAYKQPVLRAEIERVRGVDCGGVLKALLERGLVRIIGRENLPGRPLTYGTTKRFLEVFELKNLDGLPSLEEMALDDTLTGPAREPELFPILADEEEPFRPVEVGLADGPPEMEPVLPPQEEAALPPQEEAAWPPQEEAGLPPEEFPPEGPLEDAPEGPVLPSADGFSEAPDPFDRLPDLPPDRLGPDIDPELYAPALPVEYYLDNPPPDDEGDGEEEEEGEEA